MSAADEGAAGAGSDACAGGTEDGGVWTMCYFLHRHLEFRLPEIESLAEMEGYAGQIEWRVPDGGCEDSPFWRLRTPSLAAAAAIARRSMLVKAVLDIWAEGDTLDEMVAAAVAYPEEKRAPFLAPNTTFKVHVEGFGCKHSMAQQTAIHQRMESIPFCGTVDLKTPQYTFWVLQVGPQHPCLPPVPQRFYFGREVVRGDRSPLRTLDLSTRRYLGPTTMDHEVALIMCNQALARKGRLLFDPFVGTGSILLAAALYGAYTVGTDIDARVLRMGKVDAAGAPVNNWTNFDDAALPRPLALLQADLARPPWRAGLRGWADAIVCDPPYGVRAGGRKSGGRKQDSAPDVPVKPVPDHLRATHIPSTAFYPMAECVADLLDTAAATLVMHGRLVYFYPTSLMEDRPEALPTHPCLQTIANSQQLLSTRLGRRLVTMRKVREWYPGAKAEAKAVADEVAASTAAAAEAAARAAAAAAKGVHPHSGGAWSASINAQPGAARAVIPTHRNKRT